MAPRNVADNAADRGEIAVLIEIEMADVLAVVGSVARNRQHACIDASR